MKQGKVKPRICVVNKNHPHSRGLVHCWPFTENGGAIVRDVIKKNDIAMVNFSTTAWRKHALGSIVKGTDTDSNYLLPTYFTGISHLVFYSVCLWFRVYTAEGSNSSFWWYEDRNSGEFRQTRIYLSPGTGVINFNITDTASGNTLITTTGNQRDGLWHHYVAVRDNQNVYIYIDGQLRASKIPATIGVINHNLRSTFMANCGTTVFSDDDMAEIRMYKRALSQKEVQSIYTNPWDIYYSKINISTKKSRNINLLTQTYRKRRIE